MRATGVVAQTKPQIAKAVTIMSFVFDSSANAVNG